jgi:nucleoside-diphosphate-sugar epimerase
MAPASADLDDVRIVLTGPTGWIGSAMLDHLARALGPGWREKVTLFGSSARMLRAPDGRELSMRALEEIGPADVEGAAVVHLAYLTKEKAGLLGERRFTDTNLAIDDLVLNALAPARPRGVFVASSGAASLAARGVDRHPYGLTKLRQEDRFLEWGARADVPVLAGRIFNIAGPYMNKIESYALGSFISQAEQTGTIRIEARIPVFRSNLHVDDLCGLVLGSLRSRVGRPQAIDLCGSEIVEMEDVARIVADQFAGEINVVRDEVDCTRASVYLGDFTHTKVLGMELGQRFAPFAQQVADTCRWLGSKGRSTRFT